jgi:hypothetical protein
LPDEVELIDSSFHVDFSFMHSGELRNIVERDYAELQQIKRVGGLKSQYILYGGLIEAILLDALQRPTINLTTSKKAPRSKGVIRPVDEWGLGDLIDVSRELDLITAEVEQFSHGVRNYRNLVHPSKELKSARKIAKEEAAIAEKVLEIVIRELKH